MRTLNLAELSKKAENIGFFLRYTLLRILMKSHVVKVLNSSNSVSRRVSTRFFFI